MTSPAPERAEDVLQEEQEPTASTTTEEPETAPKASTGDAQEASKSADSGDASGSPQSKSAEEESHPSPSVPEAARETRTEPVASLEDLRIASRATESIVQSFRQVIEQRGELHSAALASTYRKNAENMRESLRELQTQLCTALDLRGQGLLAEIDQKIVEIRNTASVIVSEADKARGELVKATSQIETAHSQWNEAHSSTFRALERFQKEYRSTIEQFEKSTARTKEITESLQSFRSLSIPMMILAAAVGTLVGLFLAKHLGLL